MAPPGWVWVWRLGLMSVVEWGLAAMWQLEEAGCRTGGFQKRAVGLLRITCAYSRPFPQVIADSPRNLEHQSSVYGKYLLIVNPRNAPKHTKVRWSLFKLGLREWIGSPTSKRHCSVTLPFPQYLPLPPVIRALHMKTTATPIMTTAKEKART